MNPTREELLFALAPTKPVSERVVWLDREFGDDKELRARREALLAAHEQPETLLATQAEAARPTIKLDLADAPDEAVGQTLGRYKLLEQIGEGGCGMVYVAEQKEPVRRKVALKVIKLGMDTKQVVARFEAEWTFTKCRPSSTFAKVNGPGVLMARFGSSSMVESTALLFPSRLSREILVVLVGARTSIGRPFQSKTCSK